MKKNNVKVLRGSAFYFFFIFFQMCFCCSSLNNFFNVSCELLVVKQTSTNLTGPDE